MASKGPSRDVPVVAAEEFIAAIAAQGNLDVLAGGPAHPIGRQERAVTQRQAELLNQGDQIVRRVRVALEGGMPRSQSPGNSGGNGGFVVARIGPAHREGGERR